MPIIREMPYSNLHDLNIDWILNIIKDFNAKYSNLEETFDGMVDSINAARAQALSDIESGKTDALSAMQTYLNTCYSELDRYTTAFVTQLQNVTNEEISALNTVGQNQYNNVTDAGTAAINALNAIVSSIPADYNDALNQMMLITSLLNQSTNYPLMIQGYYASGTPSIPDPPAKTLVNDNTIVSTLLTSGAQNLTVDVEVTQGDVIISSISYWTISNGTETFQPEPVNSTSVHFTFPANTTDFFISFVSSTSPATTISPSDFTATISWSCNLLDYDDYPEEGSQSAVKSNGINFDIEELRNNFGIIETKKITTTLNSGYYWNTTTGVAVLTALSSYRAYTATVSPGQHYRIVGRSTSSHNTNMAVFADADYNIIKRYGRRSGTFETYYVTVPDNATYLLMSTNNGATCSAYLRTLKPILQSAYPSGFNFEGKTIAIIGDSISTNGDFTAENNLGNVPEIVVTEEDVTNQTDLTAYVTLWDVYKIQTVNNVKQFVATNKTIGGHLFTEEEVGTEITIPGTDLVMEDVGKTIGMPKNNNSASTVTWWEVAMETLGFNVIPVCWSGSSITDHEELNKENASGDVDQNGKYVYKCAHSFHPSQIRKCGTRTPGTMDRTPPDIIIIYRGTNDLSHTPYARITDYLDTYPTAYPDSDTYVNGNATGYDYAKGMRMCIKALRDAYPDAQIVICTLNYFKRMTSVGKWTTNGTDTWQKYNNLLRTIAAFEGCNIIDFAIDGLNWANAAEEYYQEGTASTQRWTHPTTKGHKVLGNRAIIDLLKLNSMV